ncbi:hypothetical protein DPMN_002566 [Dreissena polymorpha]|uniref:Uncharacterized protein n=1 Tax=Dreissena polymorpha TaxID=45954 RepID=A0A9D4RU09_DREPO|nr:hypothetical protein DPMN_002566 [Dreissena polymorpha]
MSGGLHIEMTAFKTLGNWLECSGWTTAICTAEIATSGVTDSFIKVTHLSRTWLKTTCHLNKPCTQQLAVVSSS